MPWFRRVHMDLNHRPRTQDLCIQGGMTESSKPNQGMKELWWGCFLVDYVKLHLVDGDGAMDAFMQVSVIQTATNRRGA